MRVGHVHSVKQTVSRPQLVEVAGEGLQQALRKFVDERYRFRDEEVGAVLVGGFPHRAVRFEVVIAIQRATNETIWRRGCGISVVDIIGVGELDGGLEGGGKAAAIDRTSAGAGRRGGQGAED